jgi:hypothetical protein
VPHSIELTSIVNGAIIFCIHLVGLPIQCFFRTCTQRQPFYSGPYDRRNTYVQRRRWLSSTVDGEPYAYFVLIQSRISIEYVGKHKFHVYYCMLDPGRISNARSKGPIQYRNISIKIKHRFSSRPCATRDTAGAIISPTIIIPTDVWPQSIDYCQ